MQYQALLFDLDGTLLDTSLGVIKAIDFIVEKFGLYSLSMEEKRSFIGPPIQNSFMLHYGCSEKRAWELATAWREAYKDQFLFEARPYKGIYELLQRCREHGIQTGVATNKREDYTLKLLEHFSFLPLFDCIVGSDFEGKRTKVDIIHLCMERLKIHNPGDCLMIGDTLGDIKAAQTAGVQALGVTYGFGLHDAEELKIKTVDSCKEIMDLIDGKGASDSDRES